MRFLLPHALWCLSGLPLLVWAYFALRRRNHRALSYSSLGVIREAMAGGSRIRPHVPALLFLAALVLCIIALARPAATITTPSHQRTIILAIDVSLSMAAADVPPSRIAAAQAAARAFIASQPRDVRIGIVTFAGAADLVQAPTSDRAKLSAALENLQLDHSTGVGIGVLASLMTIAPDEGIPWSFEIFGSGRTPRAGDHLKLDVPGDGPAPRAQVRGPGSHPSAAIVVLTDGRDTIGPPAAMAAKLAAERGVRIYTVGFGNAQTPGGAEPARTHDVRLDEESLKAIAAQTRGEYFHASTAHALNRVYRQLDSRIVLERIGLELTAIATAAAALLMLAGGLLSLLRAPRVG